MTLEPRLLGRVSCAREPRPCCVSAWGVALTPRVDMGDWEWRNVAHTTLHRSHTGRASTTSVRKGCGAIGGGGGWAVAYVEELDGDDDDNASGGGQHVSG